MAFEFDLLDSWRDASGNVHVGNVLVLLVLNRDALVHTQALKISLLRLK